jgi:hypothetical protein
VNGSEECDNGPSNGTISGKGGCTVGCTKTHFCGDGVLDVNLGEQCDLGNSNGQPGQLCDSTCSYIVQPI